MNTLRTGILMAALTGLFLAVGGVLGGSTGMVIALAFALATNLFAYWNSDKVLLSMYGAQPVDAQSAPDLYRLVEQLAAKAGLPMPRVYITDNPQPNAFATGRSPEHAAVCVTSGLLAQVNQEELAGVLAHELGHVKHRDTLTMTITAVMAGAISMLANMAFFMGGGRDRNNPLGFVGMILVMMLAPLGAMLVQSEHYQEGLPYLEKANGLIPGSWAIYFYRGKAELLLGHAATAISLLRQATELNPDDSGSFYLLAKAYKAEGRAQDATGALARVAALHQTALDVERHALKDAGIVKDAGVDRQQ